MMTTATNVLAMVMITTMMNTQTNMYVPVMIARTTKVIGKTDGGKMIYEEARND